MNFSLFKTAPRSERADSSTLERLLREEAQTLEDLTNIEDKLKFLNAAIPDICASNSAYKNVNESPYLVKLLEGLSYANEKHARLREEIDFVTESELRPLESRLAAVRAKLKDKQDEISRWRARQSQRRALVLVSDPDYLAEIDRINCMDVPRLQLKIRQVEDKVAFLKEARKILATDWGCLESVMVERLLFGSFTQAEKLAKMDEAIAVAETELAESQRRLQESAKRIRELLKQYGELILPVLKEQNEKLSALLLDAEQISLGLDNLMQPLDMLDVVRNPDWRLELAGYSFFRSGFREERFRKIELGVVRDDDGAVRRAS